MHASMKLATQMKIVLGENQIKFSSIKCDSASEAVQLFNLHCTESVCNLKVVSFNVCKPCSLQEVKISVSCALD